MTPCGNACYLSLNCIFIREGLESSFVLQTELLIYWNLLFVENVAKNWDLSAVLKYSLKDYSRETFKFVTNKQRAWPNLFWDFAKMKALLDLGANFPLRVHHFEKYFLCPAVLLGLSTRYLSHFLLTFTNLKKNFYQLILF